MDHFWTTRCRPVVEKVHAVVARSTFGSQKWQNASVSEHFCGKTRRSRTTFGTPAQQQQRQQQQQQQQRLNFNRSTDGRLQEAQG